MQDNFDMPVRSRVHRGVMIFFGVIFGSIFMVAMAFLFGYFVMLLWNWLMPVLFHLGTINYWQAFGIIILCKLLFGSFRFGRPGHWKGKRPWRNDWQENMDWRDNGDWDLKGGWHQWRYYKDYWRTEGKAAFEKYIDKMEKPKTRKK